MGQSGNTRQSTTAATIGFVVVGGVLAMWLADGAGITPSVDRSLRATYYDVRGARDTSTSVMLVTFDESTAARWGAAPWSRDELQAVIAEILDDGAALVGVLESVSGAIGDPVGALVTDGASPGQDGAREVTAWTGWGDPRVIAPASVTASVRGAGRSVAVMPEVLEIGDGAVDAVILRDRSGTPTVLGRIAERLVPARAGRDTLPVNFLGPITAVPTIAAHRVTESDELPAGTFAGRVVLIGADGGLFAQRVPTPLGPMSAAEVQAHGALGLIDGTVWRPVPWWFTWLFGALLALVAALAIPRLGTASAAVAVVALAAAIVVADYALFAGGVAAVGAARPLTAFVAALVGVWSLERGRAHRELVEFARWLGDQADKLHERSQKQWDDAALDRFLQAARMYVDFDSAVFAELPPDAHHLRIRRCVDTGEEQLLELRRDVRREPYSAAYKTHRPQWATRPFMRPEHGNKSLMVPLVELGQILGFWIVNFAEDAEVGERDIDRIEALSQQLSVALDYQRLRRRARPGRLGRAGGMLLAQIRHTRQSAATFVQEEHRRGDVLARLPVGVLVSTLWGEVEFVNTRMEQALADAGIDAPAQLGLPGLIAALSGATAQEVHDRLRALVDERGVLELPLADTGAAGAAGAGALELRCVSAGRAGRGRGTAPTHLVLTTGDYADAETLGLDLWRPVGSRAMATGPR